MNLPAAAIAALKKAKETAPAACSFTEDSYGVWAGGRLFEDKNGKQYFLPMDKPRRDLRIRGLRFLGDALVNVKGWGLLMGEPEVLLIVPVEG